MGSLDTLADIEEKIFIGTEFVTVKHFPKQSKWVCESWGKFFHYQNRQN